MASEYTFRYLSILALMLMDIISGVIKAKKKDKKLSSKIMSRGLYKKMGTILCVFTADILYVISVRYIPLELDVVMPVYLYVIATESLSIYENANDGGLIEIVKKLFNKD